MNLRKYLTLTRAGMIETLQFRISTAVAFGGNLAYLVLVYFLWKAIYASAGTDTVNGMTFTDTLIYLVLATALFNFMERFVVWQMSRDILSGKIILDLIKPIKYRSYRFWCDSGNLVMSFLMTFLPTFLVVSFLTRGAIPLGVNLLYFIVSVVLAIIINFNIDFLVGTICLYTESCWGINIMKQVTVLLLSGATIPLPFFPEPLKTVVYHLPFQSIYNTPLTLMINGGLSGSEVLTMLGTQLFWVAVMMTLSGLLWRKSLRVITVNGG